MWGVKYQFHSIHGSFLNVFDDVSVRHPLRHSDELPVLHVPLNPNEFQDVRMG